MKYHLIRHAQTDANSQGLISCMNTEELNAVGRDQAERLAWYLQTVTFEAIWVSPIQRAIATLLPFNEKSKQKYELKPFLAEGRYNIDPNAGISSPVYGEDGLPPQVETVEQFRGRVKQFIDMLFSQTADGSVLVLTHGQFIREFLNMFLGASRYVRWPVDNCSETLVEISGDVFIRHVNKNVI